ncbi:serpin family protein [Dinghuibacter silviterrae]|uniref:Serpin B n=1 Tax=Dinghuibacter silviterrae TaxID=1539049 RepID=A0A4R8DHM1_9BACT|nr:serpin family protein [Dinghuibacter silviterrae]TDW97221.1 serpin B [Dinghuibacter silviterrae]
MKRLLLALLVLSACRKGTTPTPDITHDITLPASGTAVVAAENQFSLALFQAVNLQDTVLKNKIISPFSVYMALGMADNGAAGTTLDSINKALALGALSTGDLNGTASALIQQLPGADNHVTLSVANSEWYNQQNTPMASFSQLLQNDYNAKVAGLDFSNPSSVTTINQWVANQTQQMIPQILNSIEPTEIMFLVNAVYFKGEWTTSFDAGLTQPAPFTRGDGVVENVQTMRLQSPVPIQFLITDTVTMVELPYGGKQFVMDIMMPAGDIRSFAAGLTPALLTGWISRMITSQANLTMPRFKFDYNVSMQPALTSLGMGIAFGHAADFSNMYTIPVFLSRVIHQAAIEVDESGTKAAAATVVGIGTSVAVPTNNIKLNRAFLFTIREKTSGVVLFTGILNDPLSD